MSEERRLQILRAIVQDYVSTSEPVGSKALLERHHLGVSAATVRNDMAVLEEEGLIAAPHTSAGRVPTDAGYRLFVDRLSQVKPLSRAERSAIREFLEQSIDLDDVVDRTARLLASITQQVAVMQYPSLSRSSVRHIELVPLTSSRLMVVLITSSGRVEQRVMDVGEENLASAGGEAFVARLRSRLNAEAQGRLLGDAAQGLTDLPETFDDTERASVRRVVQALTDVLAEQREERVVLAGTANLARTGGDVVSIAPVLDALEQHVVLLRLLSTMNADATDAVAVRIGAENPYEGLHTTSMVTTSYGTGAVAGLGVLGPTRMDYPSTMAAVRAVARYVSEILDQ
ncbi:heat-inducible transcriptional repressor HrcA [Luteipulveratus sp. YIM 133132]|uniref:Heat-inducible transcription repressor HrcA n=1 Tax=Luteipulveratus flavus TaxID=3031728 RepID=A0ABT6C3C7_9MICO|nr:MULTISPECIES: heat-inducible transcriptional repressor HrcA [unclassified Luteipulveratus]MDE9367573.1 heat-inducible transcriptional repressor HrcA [Luteipulveratus sp. YIM 133132]MDF8263362.1 heat-inducible transcriptional repressor HrcA [Luteipulveratus sp. YIM 133296]